MRFSTNLREKLLMLPCFQSDRLLYINWMLCYISSKYVRHVSHIWLTLLGPYHAMKEISKCSQIVAKIRA